MTALPLPPHDLPGLAPLLTGDLWHDWARAGHVPPLPDPRAAVRYVRLKPEHSCRLTLFGAEPGDHENPPVASLVLLFPDAERARTSFDKERHRQHRPGGAGHELHLDADHAAVVLPFPNDPALPAVRRVYEPDRFRRALAELIDGYPTEEWRIKRRSLATELLAYKPSRRAVYDVRFQVRHRDGTRREDLRLHLKLEAASTAARSYRKLAAIAECAPQQDGPRIPKPAGFLPERCLTAVHWCEGESLAPLLDRHDAAVPALLHATGTQLHRLHRLSLEIDHDLSPVEMAERTRKLARDFALLLPEASGRLEEVAEQLARAQTCLMTCTSAIVHGDFHPGQVILDDQGPLFVDFDEATRGYASNDLGGFAAYLLEKEAPEAWRQAFFAGYRESAGELPSPETIRATAASTLFGRLAVPFRTLDSNWPAIMAESLERVERVLKGEVALGDETAQ